MNETLQTIILVLGTLNALILLLRNLRKPDATDISKNANSASHKQANLRGKLRREAIDLSLLLLCSAFFSLLLTDSLIVSGKNPSPGLGAILIVVVITSVVLVMMVGAWLIGVAELVTGWLAIMTLAVLVFSSGGPFFTAEADAIVGLSLFVPTMLLVVLAASMLLYFYGNPLSRRLPKNKRISVAVILLIVVAFSSAALGRALVLNVIADARTPKLGQGRTLFHNVLQGNLVDRRQFYKLASEVALARTYRKFFRSVSEEQKSLQPASGSTLTQIPNTPSSNTRRSQLQAPSPTPTPGRDTAVPNTERTLKEQGFARTSFLVSYFNTSDVVTQEQYLIRRLDWVHPVGTEGQSVASISLPGTTADNRLEATSYIRVFVALYDQPNLRQTLLKEFEYPEQTAEFYQARDNRSDSRLRIFGGLDSEPPSTLYKPTLFPKFEVTVSSSQLRQQISLPLKPEANVVFRQYSGLALLIAKEQFKNRLPASDFDRLANSFDALDDQAQDAFLTYVISNRKVPSDRVYQMLIDLKGVNFSSFATSQDPLATEKLVSMLQGNRLNDVELQTVADQVVASQSRQAKDTLVEVLRDEHPDFPIKKLFQPQVFDLVDQIQKSLGADKSDFFNAVADPIWVVAKHFAIADWSKTGVRGRSAEFPMSKYLEDFRSLEMEDQSGVLQQLAIVLYQPGGPYSLDPIRSLISQMRSWNDAAGLFCAASVPIPALLICLLVGGFLARKLTARDRKRELIGEELESHPQHEGILGNPVANLHGREEILRSLQNLAERGWSTIGIVGRRGVGKSRVLHSLFSVEPKEPLTPTVKAWVSAPSKFQEEDFVFSVFERLALSTEETIAAHLGASPISIRKIEHRAALISAWCYMGALLALGAIIYQMFNRLTRSDIVVIWLPIVALVFASASAFIYYLSKRQPVDLSSWLQRDRKHNPHTVMLYRDVYEALVTLRDRRKGRSVGMYRLRGETLKQIAMSGFAVLFSLCIGYVVLSMEYPYSNLSLWLTLMLAALACWAWLYLFQRRAAIDERVVGQSLMTLIADYRSFATTIVHRLSQGALGHSAQRKFSVLICIDELDKIVESDEIRVFLRKIKAIFEVPGVYYYVSLAEDTLTALYLGSASGKSEIDSAFDHIVAIRPVSCDIGQRIAAEYLSAHGMPNVPIRLPRTVATVCFGIPRDIIRRCDELLAGDQNRIDVAALPREIREDYCRMGYDLRQLSKEQVQDLTTQPQKAAIAAQALFSDEATRAPHDSAKARLILSIWILSVIEILAASKDDDLFEQLTERLSSMGYRVPTDPSQDVASDIETVHRTLIDSH